MGFLVLRSSVAGGGGGGAGTGFITGSGFGAPSNFAPIFFQPFVDTPNGGDWEDAGFDYVSSGNGVSAENFIDMTDGVGGGSYRLTDDVIASDWFPHHGIYLADLTQVFCSLWYKTGQTSGSASGFFQYKGIRAGWRNGETDPGAMYGDTPKMATETITVEIGENGEPQIEFWPTGQGSPTVIAGSGPNAHTTDGNWHQQEVFFRWNDVGSSNAIMQLWQDGTQYVNSSNRNVRTASEQLFDWIQFNPGVTNDYTGSAWNLRQSRIYVSASRARIYYKNAGGQRFIVEPTAWVDGRIDFDTRTTGIPSGYTDIYVTLEDGSEVGPYTPTMN